MSKSPLTSLAGRERGPETVAQRAALASFGRAAPVYLDHARVQTELAGWLAEWLPAQRTGRALEIGAGPGVFTRKLLPWAGPLLATDLAPAMCAAGKSAVPEADWRVMAAEAPAGGPWDWIFCSSMLQWVAEPAAVFAAWHDALAPRGRVLAGLFVAESLPELQSVLDGCPPPLVWRSPAAWRAALADGGLRLVRDGAERRVFRHASALAFFRALHGIGAAPQPHLSPGRLRRLLREYTDRHGAAGGVPATWTFYRFEAERMPE